MGSAISSSIAHSSARRRTSRARRAVLQQQNALSTASTVEVATAGRAASPSTSQRRLGDAAAVRKGTTGTPSTLAANPTAAAAAAASSLIAPDFDRNACAENSLCVASIIATTAPPPAPSQGGAVAATGVSSSSCNIDDAVNPLCRPSEASAHTSMNAATRSADLAEVDVHTNLNITDNQSSPNLTLNAGATEKNGDYPLPREFLLSATVRDEDKIRSARDSFQRATITAASFHPWLPRSSASTSSNNANGSLNHLTLTRATAEFKATLQQYCDESRSRSSGVFIKADRSSPEPTSRDDLSEPNAQVPAAEWTRLTELMHACDALLCEEDRLWKSRSRSKTDSLAEVPPAVAATAMALPGEAGAATALASPIESPQLVASNSLTTGKLDFSPLQLRFSLTTSLATEHHASDVEFARAIADTDTHATLVRTLLASWHFISVHHLDDFANEMGSLLATKHPEYEGLLRNTTLTEQACGMLQMVGQAVMTAARPGEMFHTLIELGAMHRRYRVGVDYFEVLHRTFMEVLPRYLKDFPERSRKTSGASSPFSASLSGSLLWSPLRLCEEVWEPFWHTAVALLTHGFTTARGDWYAAHHEAEWMADVKVIMRALKEQQHQHNYRGTFFPYMLDLAEATDPTMAQFCLMREPRTAIRAFEALTSLALDAMEATEQMQFVEQLAHQHMMYGVTERGLHGFRQLFIETCEHFVQLSTQPELWSATADAAQSLGFYWDLLTMNWIRGVAATHKSLADIQQLQAPSGSQPFCMMYADIEANTRLWDRHPAMMADAVDAYNTLVRRLIADYGAYEVKTVDDAFVVATKDVVVALQIAVALQLELMRGPIVEGFTMAAVVQGGGDPKCWRPDTLRVRVGIHYCTDAAAVYDSVQRRFDYYGPSVNCAAATVAAAAGGQILMTRDAVNALKTHGSDESGQKAQPVPIAVIEPGASPMDTVMADLVEFQWWGNQHFRGTREPVGLYSVLPMKLSGRRFPYYVGSRKVLVSAPGDVDGRKKVYRLSMTELKSGNLSHTAMGLFNA